MATICEVAPSTWRPLPGKRVASAEECARIVREALERAGATGVLVRDYGAAINVTRVHVDRDEWEAVVTLPDGQEVRYGGSLYRLGVIRRLRGEA